MPVVGELTPMWMDGYGAAYAVYGHVTSEEFVDIVAGYDPDEARILPEAVWLGGFGRWVPAVDDGGKPTGGMTFSHASPGRGAWPVTYWESLEPLAYRADG